MMKALFVGNRLGEVYPPQVRRQVDELVDVIAPFQASNIVDRDPRLLSDVEIIMSGWGAPKLDRNFLAAAPKLKAFFYAGGATESILSEAVWARNIIVCSGIHANSIPVAEFTFAQIILSLKNVHPAARAMKEHRAKTYRLDGVQGAYGSRVGLIGLGRVSRLLIGLLQHIDVRVGAYDPGVSSEEFARLGLDQMSLEVVFRSSDVVSLHAPVLETTKGMITGALLESMKSGATFINTARGVLVRDDELIQALCKREDLFAILDVTWPEPPGSSNPLWTLPNVLLTPHIAGSQGRERYRVGQCMVADLRNFLQGSPLRYEVRPKQQGQVHMVCGSGAG